MARIVSEENWGGDTFENLQYLEMIYNNGEDFSKGAVLDMLS